MLLVSAKPKGQVQVCHSHWQRKGSRACLQALRPGWGLTVQAAKPGVLPALIDAGQPPSQIASGNCSALKNQA